MLIAPSTPFRNEEQISIVKNIFEMEKSRFVLIAPSTPYYYFRYNISQGRFLQNITAVIIFGVYNRGGGFIHNSRYFLRYKKRGGEFNTKITWVYSCKDIIRGIKSFKVSISPRGISPPFYISPPPENLRLLYSKYGGTSRKTINQN